LARDWAGISWGFSPKEVWDVRLSRLVPLELSLDVGASDSEIDLTGLRVRELDLKAGAADIDVRFPENAGYTDVSINAGAVDLDLVVPQGVAARITVDSGVSSINVDEGRFPKAGDRYESTDFDSTENRLVLDIDVGAASVNVR
jgi:hypothetical protein